MKRYTVKLIASPLFFFSLFSSTNLFAADPPVISIGAVDSNSIAVSWTASERGRVTYSLYRYDGGDCAVGETLLEATRQKDFTVSGLVADTTYSFRVDAVGRSGLVPGECSEPVKTELDGGGPPGGECGYPGFSDPPGAGTNADFVPPDWLEEQNNPALVFHDSFDGTLDGTFDEKWIDEQMIDALNRAGNKGINADGSICLLDDNPYCAPDGKRWSAWYNENLDQNRKSVNGVLEMGGTADPTADLTRPGAGAPWQNNRLSTGFITTWAREFDVSNVYVESSAVVDGKDKWTYPMYLETMVNFERMNTPGFRLSMWLMPATYDDPPNNPARLATNDEAYNGNFSDGFELDIFEYEPWKPDCGNLLEFSWINSFATKGKSGRNASGKNHFEGDEEGYADIGTGWRKFGLLWEQDRIQWVFEDKVVLEITDPGKIPDIYQYLIVSREMTNGITGGAEVYDGNEYFLPPEVGLYGWAGGSNVGEYIDNINNDVAQIDYIKIFKPGP